MDSIAETLLDIIHCGFWVALIYIMINQLGAMWV